MWKVDVPMRLPVFRRRELVARNERSRELWKVRRQPLLRIVERVAAEELRVVGQDRIHAQLREVLIERLIEGEGEAGQTAAQVLAVGPWETH